MTFSAGDTVPMIISQMRREKQKKAAQQKTFTSPWADGLDPDSPGGDLGPGLCEPGEPGYTRGREWPRTPLVMLVGPTHVSQVELGEG